MGQLALFNSDEMPVELNLPPLILRLDLVKCGNAAQVLRKAGTYSVEEVTDENISPRIKEAAYKLSNGERIIVTHRSKVTRPPNTDGVLRALDSGKLQWLSHKVLEKAQEDFLKFAPGGYAEEIANSWDGEFHFVSERVNGDGEASSGLRPPQIGALHAIGAHWSLARQPATIVMPTGTGKTETMLATLAAYLRKPLLVVVPWDLLRHQTFEKFLTFGYLRKFGVLSEEAPNPVVGVIRKRPKSLDDLRIFEDCNVVVSTMSSLGGAEVAELLPEIAKRVGALILDEAHHVPANTWTNLRDAFSDSKILQFTATPFRRDKKLVDGAVIYNYPLRSAQVDGYFKKIAFEPIYGLGAPDVDQLIAEKAVECLRADLDNGLNHLAMARCDDIPRAEKVFGIYQSLAPDLSPQIIHSGIADSKERVDALRAGDSRIVVCVDMLGEGFDLPELKIAAVHDMHKSLAILLQFTGRFTRSSGKNIGDATVVADISDMNVSQALERLYSEDADWNELLSEMSSDAVKDHAELIDFLNSSQRLGDDENDDISISHQLLRPTLSTLIYEADTFIPKKFHEGLPKGLDVSRVWLNEKASTLFFVTREQASVKWTRSQEVMDRNWHLFVLHYDPDQNLLFLSSTDHRSLFEKLAHAVGAKGLVSGETIFRTLGNISRLTFQNIGVKKHGRRNLSFAMYTGAQVEEAMSITEKAGSVKNNISGTGWENGEQISIGCSKKGRVWAREQTSLPKFTTWCKHVGRKVMDESIDVGQIMANVLIPKEVTDIPETSILSVEWPYEIISRSEDKIVLRKASAPEAEMPLYMLEIAAVAFDKDSKEIHLELRTVDESVWTRLGFRLGGEKGYTFRQLDSEEVTIQIGRKEYSLVEWLTDYPLLIRFVDLSELDGNLLVEPYAQRELAIADERFEVWDWQGVDLTKESMFKDGELRKDSVQWKAAMSYFEGGFDLIFNDDAAGEAADLICMKEETDHIKLALVHCKFAGGSSSGARVGDVVEVCSQAVRSAKWKGKFHDLCRHITNRESRLGGVPGQSRFIAGSASQVGQFSKKHRFKEIRPEVLIIQPGISKSGRTPEQNTVLAAAMTYLKETIGVDLDVICSS